MKTIKNLDEFVREYRSSPSLRDTGEGILAAFGSMTFVYHCDHGSIKNERYVVDLSAIDVDRIVRVLEESKP